MITQIIVAYSWHSDIICLNISQDTSLCNHLFLDSSWSVLVFIANLLGSNKSWNFRSAASQSVSQCWASGCVRGVCSAVPCVCWRRAAPWEVDCQSLWLPFVRDHVFSFFCTFHCKPGLVSSAVLRYTDIIICLVSVLIGVQHTVLPPWTKVDTMGSIWQLHSLALIPCNNAFQRESVLEGSVLEGSEVFWWGSGVFWRERLFQNVLEGGECFSVLKGIIPAGDPAIAVPLFT